MMKMTLPTLNLESAGAITTGGTHTQHLTPWIMEPAGSMLHS